MPTPSKLEAARAAKLEASLSMLDRTFAKMKAENAAARARRTPAEQKAWEASLKDFTYGSTCRPSDAEFDYHTAQAGNGYYA